MLNLIKRYIDNIQRTFSVTSVKKTVQDSTDEQSLDRDADDANVLVGFVRLGVHFRVGDPLDGLHPFRTPSEHCVFVIEPRLETQQR